MAMDSRERIVVDPEAKLNRARHVKYWLRCLKTLLPTAYTSNDSQRMTFAFFTLCALDLLSELDNNTTEAERKDYANWIYHCQHPHGGFRGFTGANGGVDNCWDPANLAATFFALAALMVLGDGMDQVRGRQCLLWLRELQKEDGSFGEALGKDGRVEGGQDIRYCYLAAAVRWILRRGLDADAVPDIDVDALDNFVQNSITFEGGIGKSPFQEAHAGWTYCGIGVLKMLGRLPDNDSVTSKARNERFLSQDTVARMVRWLVNRQTFFVEEDDPTSEGDILVLAGKAGKYNRESDPDQSVNPDGGVEKGEQSSSTIVLQPPFCAGQNGRCNKIADTCYSFWVGASLAMLQSSKLQDSTAARTYLLDMTQHFIGGFGKLSKDPPDILHSCLGLAALALMGEPDVRPIDPMLCISKRAREDFCARIETIPGP